MAERLTLLPYQRAQASLSAGAGGFGKSSAEARRVSASEGNLVATLVAVLAGLFGIMGEKIRRNLPGSELVTSIWEGVRGLGDDGGVTEEEMGEVVPRCWRDRAFRPEEVSASGNSDREVLSAHGAETTNSRKVPKNSENRSTVCGTTGTSHHWTDSPPVRARRRGRSFRGERNPRMRKCQATESVRTRSCRVVTSEAGGRSTRHTSPGVPVRRAATSGEEHLAATCPACDAADANTRHARLCHRAGTQVNQHQPLVHATSRFLSGCPPVSYTHLTLPTKA